MTVGRVWLPTHKNSPKQPGAPLDQLPAGGRGLRGQLVGDQGQELSCLDPSSSRGTRDWTGSRLWQTIRHILWRKNIRLNEENECQRRKSSPVCVRRSIIVRRTIIVILRNQLVLLFLSIICHRIVASTWFMEVTRQRDISSRRNQHSLHWFHSIMGFCHNFFLFSFTCVFCLMFAVS